ncbi:MAG: glycerate kinase [Propionibacteriales bacterium]|nr:glycerate kinase [Propionibacteriales bacterium]
MRVLVAPDSFAGTLSAVEAAEAIAAGWRRRAPGDELVLAPMSDGGPGFVDVLHASLGGDLLSVTVPDQYGNLRPTTVLRMEDTAYVESAQASGLHLSGRRDPEHATSCGVGQLLDAAIDDGARRVVIGLGGAGTNDGGAGLLAGLGATSSPPGALLGGPHSLERLETVELAKSRSRCAGVELVIAADVDIPLLGLRGTTNAHGTQRGLAPERRHHVDAQLERLADATDRTVADAKGSGAGGGLGFALLLLGGGRVDGVTVVSDAVGLSAAARDVDLVVTGEGAFDFSSRSGKVPYGVASIAAEAIRPCIALAGEVLVGAREMRALGIESGYAMVDLVGRDAALAEPAASLSALAERVARSWST